MTLEELKKLNCLSIVRCRVTGVEFNIEDNDFEGCPLTPLRLAVYKNPENLQVPISFVKGDYLRDLQSSARIYESKASALRDREDYSGAEEYFHQDWFLTGEDLELVKQF